MITAPVNRVPNQIAKLICVQPLADHDGAAIFAVEILSFEKQTGVLLKRVVIKPDLDEQIVEERAIDTDVLSNILAGKSTQNYINELQATIPKGIQAIIPILTQEIFDPAIEASLFWWNAAKSYPVLRAFYVQNNEDVDSTLEIDPVIDVRSFIGTKRIEKLDDNEQVYTVLNWIAQRFMPRQENIKESDLTATQADRMRSNVVTSTQNFTNFPKTSILNEGGLDDRN